MKTSREFKIYEKRRASGAIQYRVDLGMVNGKRVQKNFGTKEEAEAYRNQCIAQGANIKTEVLQELDAAMRHDILACLERLRVAGSTIKEATDFFLKHSKPSKGNIHLSELVTHWEKIKRGAGMSPTPAISRENSPTMANHPESTFSSNSARVIWHPSSSHSEIALRAPVAERG